MLLPPSTLNGTPKPQRKMHLHVYSPSVVLQGHPLSAARFSDATSLGWRHTSPSPCLGHFQAVQSPDCAVISPSKADCLNRPASVLGNLIRDE